MVKKHVCTQKIVIFLKCSLYFINLLTLCTSSCILDRSTTILLHHSCILMYPHVLFYCQIHFHHILNIPFYCLHFLFIHQTLKKTFFRTNGKDSDKESDEEDDGQAKKLKGQLNSWVLLFIFLLYLLKQHNIHATYF